MEYALTVQIGKGVVAHVGTALLSLGFSVLFAATAGEVTGLISAILLGAALILEFPMCIPYCAVIISSKRCMKYSAFHTFYVSMFLLIVTLLNIASVVLLAISTATQTDTVGQKVLIWRNWYLFYFSTCCDNTRVPSSIMLVSFSRNKACNCSHYF